MIRSDNNRFGKPLYILYPGDHHAAADNSLIATVVGSCVAVCLYDYRKMIGGVGHFIVPGSIGTEGIIADEVAAQGITSMEHLIGEIVKLGGDRKSFRATLYGAGEFSGDHGLDNVAGSNIQFLHEYFKLEKIQVAREDLGGNYRRKIFFCPRTGSSFRKILMNNRDHSEFMRLESEYINGVFGNNERFGKVLLFD
ncbi:MAG: chemotaxis protein CheD [Spirochaetes bacterium]|nr:chemotaxis protein CheD [Spirochaetota bacterium]